MTAKNILIVDDELVQIKLMSKFVTDIGHNPIAMSDGNEVIDYFINKKTLNGVRPNEVSVMLLDLSMPETDGISILRQIAHHKGDLQVIILTASDEVSSAITSANLGAMDYIVKGEKDLFARVTTSINSAIAKKALKQQVVNLERNNNQQVSFSDLIGNSKDFISTINLAKKASNSNIPILIDGESGTGKELLARAIHGSGSKSGKPFIVVDCEAIKQSDADLILFGSKDVPGKIRESDGGTLFLNNVHALNSSIQGKILKLAQEGLCEQVDNKTITRVSIRIISSTDQDLESYVRHDKFREDLYYCLGIFLISIPSLKERGGEDIKILAKTFCRDFSISENKNIKGIDEDTLYMISNFDWEDNIRQLRNYIFRAVILCNEDYLKSEHFPQIVNYNNVGKSKRRPKEFTVKDGILDLFYPDGKCKNLEEIEAEIFTKLLSCFDGNLSEVSKKLKVGRSTIYRKLKPDF
ncbi:MAG: DNA-binding NtrC family response regulator [Rickettsiales bacterium]|jgi:DNA-binding NtrC family response regulator